MPAGADVLYFTTRRESLKARRIRDGGRVTVRVGARDTPARPGHAEWVLGRPDLEQAVLAHYRRAHWLLGPLWMGRRIRTGLAAGTSVLIRVTLVLV